MKPNQTIKIASLSAQNTITGKELFKGELDISTLEELKNDRIYITALKTDSGELSIFIDDFEFDYFS